MLLVHILVSSSSSRQFWETQTLPSCNCNRDPNDHSPTSKFSLWNHTAQDHSEQTVTVLHELFDWLTPLHQITRFPTDNSTRVLCMALACLCVLWCVLCPLPYLLLHPFIHINAIMIDFAVTFDHAARLTRRAWDYIPFLINDSTYIAALKCLRELYFM